MFAIEKAWQQGGCPEPRPRQVFVTKSRNLAQKVEEYFMHFIRSLTQESHVPQHVLDVLQRWNKRARRGLMNVEEGDHSRSDLPAKFSELTDDNFPLFITIDGVSVMFPSLISHYLTIQSFVLCWKRIWLASQQQNKVPGPMQQRTPLRPFIPSGPVVIPYHSIPSRTNIGNTYLKTSQKDSVSRNGWSC
jgi:hypothetical protein